jgi:hypothetical protein
MREHDVPMVASGIFAGWSLADLAAMFVRVYGDLMARQLLACGEEVELIEYQEQDGIRGVGIAGEDLPVVLCGLEITPTGHGESTLTAFGHICGLDKWDALAPRDGRLRGAWR